MLGEDPLLELRFVPFVLITILSAIQIPQDQNDLRFFQLKGWNTQKKNNAIEKFYLKHDGSSSNDTPLLFATTTFICDRIWSLYTDRVGLLSERVVSTDRSLGRGGSRVDLIWWLVLGGLRRNRRRCRSLVTHTYHLFLKKLYLENLKKISLFVNYQSIPTKRKVKIKREKAWERNRERKLVPAGGRIPIATAGPTIPF